MGRRVGPAVALRIRAFREGRCVEPTLGVVKVTVCDVGLSKGRQNEATVLAPETRAELVSRVATAQLARIEAVSFVRDDLVPQMAGAEEVVAAVRLATSVELSGLVL